MKTCVCAGVVSVGMAVACQAQWVNQRLNDIAVTNEFGEIIVLHDGGGTLSGCGHAVAFDGDTNTYTDLTINNGQGAWVGFELQEPRIITSVRFFGRANWRGRVRGVQIQGANTRDFSDADTLWTILAPDQWDPVTWREEQFSTFLSPKTYTFVRFYCPLPNSYGGNIAEMEFYGADPWDLSVTVPTPPPPITFSGCINWRMNLCWTGDPTVTFLYEIGRKMAHEADFTTLGLRIAEANEQHFMDTSLMLYQDAEYRIRAYDYQDTSPWATVQVSARNAATGQWIGTQGTWGAGWTGDKALDGNVTTFFDGPTANDCWVGLDFGRELEIIGLSYVPRRDGNAGRIRSAWFEVADNPEFDNPTLIHTTAASVTPPLNAVTTVPLDMPSVTARYARFCSPNNGFGNIAEMEFVLAPDTRPPNGLSVTAADLTNPHAVLTWCVSDAAGLISSVLVYRATSPFGPYAVMTPGGIPPSQTTWTDTSIVPSVCYYYKVASLLEGIPTREASSDYVTYVPLMHIERDRSNLSQLRPGMTAISTHGAFNPNLDVGNIFDGDVTTFADINARNPGIGVNLAKPHHIHFMRFATRTNQLGRINGAELRGSNSSSDYTNNFTRLAVFAGAKAEAFVTQQTETQEAFQYIFVQRPDDGEFFGNLTELELYGIDPDLANSVPKAPVISHAFRPSGKVDLSWTAEGARDFFRIERSTDGGASWTTLGNTAGETLTFTDQTPLRNQQVLYRVTAVCTGPPEALAYSDTYPLYTYGVRNGTVLMLK